MQNNVKCRRKQVYSITKMIDVDDGRSFLIFSRGKLQVSRMMTARSQVEKKRYSTSHVIRLFLCIKTQKYKSRFMVFIHRFQRNVTSSFVKPSLYFLNRYSCFIYLQK